MDDLEDELRLLSTWRRAGLIARVEGAIGTQRGRYCVEEREAGGDGWEWLVDDKDAGINGNVSDVLLRLDQVDGHSNEDDVILHFADVLVLERAVDRIRFWAHGGGLLLVFETKEGKGLINALVQRKILQTAPGNLFVPTKYVARRLFAAADGSNSASPDSISSSYRFHSLNDAVTEGITPVEQARRSFMKTFAKVPKALQWLQEHNRPFLNEIGIVSDKSKEVKPGPSIPSLDLDVDQDRPYSPFPDSLTPVYHIAKYRRGIPVTNTIFKTYLGPDDEIVDANVLKIAIESGGVSEDCRRSTWPYIIGMFQWESTGTWRRTKEHDMRELYERVKEAAEGEKSKESLRRQVKNTEGVVEDHPLLQIRKDVTRTDRDVAALQDDDAPLLARMEEILSIYALEHPSIGYCQGMSDLLSPILWVFREDHPSIPYFAFAKMMERTWRTNFLHTGEGISTQLKTVRVLMKSADQDIADLYMNVDPDYHSLYRWFLVQFKRELGFSDIARLWEVMWMDGQENLQVYIALGLLIRHRDQLLTSCPTFDRLVKFVNLMSMRMDVDLALHDAFALRRKYPLPSNLEAES